jgi:hypothetical protein
MALTLKELATKETVPAAMQAARRMRLAIVDFTQWVIQNWVT